MHFLLPYSEACLDVARLKAAVTDTAQFSFFSPLLLGVGLALRVSAQLNRPMSAGASVTLTHGAGAATASHRHQQRALCGLRVTVWVESVQSEFQRCITHFHVTPHIAHIAHIVTSLWVESKKKR